MKHPAIVATLLAPLLLSACAATGGEPRYGVCRQQIADYVQNRLGQTVTRIQIQSYSERTPPVSLFDPGNALAYVEECDGFHSFEVRGTWDLCENIPHYGRSSGSYIRYEGAFEGCRKPG